MVSINLTGTFLVTRRAIPLRSEAATIITMPSLAGRFGYPDRIAYSTTKRGLVGSAKTLAMELGSDGITSNTIHPGAVAGERIDRVLQGRADASGLSWTKYGVKPWSTSRSRSSSTPQTSPHSCCSWPGRTHAPSAVSCSRSTVTPIHPVTRPGSVPIARQPQDRDDFAVRSSRWGVGRVPVPRFTGEARRASRRRALGFRCPASAG